MEISKWKKCILETIEDIASEKYQRESWFGNGEFVSSPEELYCQLFDDYMYDEFLASENTGMTESQMRIGILLKEKMEKFWGWPR